MGYDAICGTFNHCAHTFYGQTVSSTQGWTDGKILTGQKHVEKGTLMRNIVYSLYIVTIGFHVSAPGAQFRFSGAPNVDITKGAPGTARWTGGSVEPCIYGTVNPCLHAFYELTKPSKAA